MLQYGEQSVTRANGKSMNSDLGQRKITENGFRMGRNMESKEKGTVINYSNRGPLKVVENGSRLGVSMERDK